MMLSWSILGEISAYSCISAAEAADFSICTSVESEEGQDMNMEGIAHILVFFIIYS